MVRLEGDLENISIYLNGVAMCYVYVKLECVCVFVVKEQRILDWRMSCVTAPLGGSGADCRFTTELFCSPVYLLFSTGGKVPDIYRI